MSASGQQMVKNAMEAFQKSLDDDRTYYIQTHGGVGGELGGAMGRRGVTQVEDYIRDNYHCRDCDWFGEEPPVERDGDPYDPNTNFWRCCPVCWSTNLYPVEDADDSSM